MQSLNKWLEIGINSDVDVKKIRNIKISNGLCLFTLLNVFIYVTLSLLYIPEYLGYFVLIGIVAIVAILCNKMTLYALCKFICVSSTPLIASFFHIHILKLNQPLHTGITLIQLSLLVVPWILYDSKSKIEMYVGILFGCICIFLVEPLNFLIEPKSSTDIFYTSFLSNTFIITACFIVTSCLYINQTMINEMDGKSEELNEFSKTQNEQLIKKEIELTLYIKEIELKQDEDKKQEWINIGIAQCAEILRQTNTSISQFSMDVLRFVIKYFESNQGSFFVLNEDNESDKYIQLTACYAYDRNKHIVKRVEFGEGLVGTAFLEKDVIYMTDLPDNYIQITSGLGEALPRCIIILPLVINESVFGIMELAFFKPLEKHKIELLKKLSENIASTIKNVKINESTKRLLADSQQQSEELRAQEEEMRQNMEEMQATQEELQRKESEINILIDSFKENEIKYKELLVEHKEEIENKDAKIERLEFKLNK